MPVESDSGFVFSSKVEEAFLLITSVDQTTAVAEGGPWPERATAALTKMLRGASAQPIATSIQRITHPSGGEAVLSKFNIWS